MDNIFILFLLGFLIGTVGTIIGAGGGFILVPLLIFTNPNLPPRIVTAISIAVVAANAVSGSIAYARARKIDYKAGLVFGLSTIPGSIAGVYVVQYVPQKLFQLVFGLLLLAVAFFLFTKKKLIHTTTTIYPITTGTLGKTLIDKEGHIYQYSYPLKTGIMVSVAVGFFSPLLGIGGGIIHVPALVQLLHFPVYIATATSHFVLAIMSVVSVVTNCIEGNYHAAFVQKMLAGLCTGVVCGAQLGAVISHKINSAIIIKLLAVCLAIVGARMLL